MGWPPLQTGPSCVHCKCFFMFALLIIVMLTEDVKPFRKEAQRLVGYVNCSLKDINT